MKVDKCSYCKKPSKGEEGVRGTVGGTMEEGFPFYEFCSSGCYTRVSLHEAFGLATFDNGVYRRIA